jgi:hypothetical protein
VSPRLSQDGSEDLSPQRANERLDKANEALLQRQRKLRQQREQRRLAKLAAAAQGEVPTVPMADAEADEDESVVEAFIVEAAAFAHPPPPIPTLESVHMLPQFWISSNEDGTYCIRDPSLRPCCARGDELGKGLLVQTTDGLMYHCRVSNIEAAVYRLDTQQRAQTRPLAWDLLFLNGVLAHPEQTSIPKDLLDAAAADSAFVEFYNPFSEGANALPSPAYVSYLRNVCAEMYAAL